MHDGSTLWQSLQYHYRLGVSCVEIMQMVWRYRLRNHVDQQRWQEVDDRLSDQLENARQWRDTCLDYFARFAEHP